MPKKRKLIELRESEIGKITTLDEFDGDVRKVVIENEKVKGNSLTITKNRKAGEMYFPESRLEVGETYVTYFKFGASGEETLQRRFNRKTKSVFERKLFMETDNGKIFITEYNGEKNINFTIKKID